VYVIYIPLIINIQESDYILSSEDEGPRNPVLEQERLQVHPEVLNHAQPEQPQPQPHPALPLNNADDAMAVYTDMVVCTDMVV
jgi:hypothetical protein